MLEDYDRSQSTPPLALSIKSFSSGRALILSNFSRDYFVVKLLGSDLSAMKRIDAYIEFAGLVQLLESLAAHERNWEGTAEWCSIENDLCLAFRSDARGHVFIEVRLDKPDDWNLSCEIETELGQLAMIARKARHIYAQIYSS